MAAIVAVGFMHLTWGIVWLVYPNITIAAHWILLGLLGTQLRAWIYILTALLAFGGCYCGWGRLAFVPQHALLLISAGAVLIAITHGQYPDGVIRPPTFIFSDQLPILTLAGWHTWGLLWYPPGAWHKVV